MSNEIVIRAIENLEKRKDELKSNSYGKALALFSEILMNEAMIDLGANVENVSEELIVSTATVRKYLGCGGIEWLKKRKRKLRLERMRLKDLNTFTNSSD